MTKDLQIEVIADGELCGIP